MFSCNPYFYVMYRDKNTGFESENYAYIGCVADQSAWRNIRSLERWKYQGNGGNDIKRSFLTCTPHHGRVCLARGGRGEGNT
jgi:hypothetical protein